MKINTVKIHFYLFITLCIYACGSKDSNPTPSIDSFVGTYNGTLKSTVTAEGTSVSQDDSRTCVVSKIGSNRLKAVLGSLDISGNVNGSKMTTEPTSTTVSNSDGTTSTINTSTGSLTFNKNSVTIDLPGNVSSDGVTFDLKYTGTLSK